MIASQAGTAAGPGTAAGAPAKQLWGTWVVVSVERGRQVVPADAPREGIEPAVWVFGLDGLRMRQGGQEERAAFTLDTSTEPPSITLTSGPEAGPPVQGIYRREADQLTICVAEPGQARPRAFPVEPVPGLTVCRFRAAR
jgi:uncharacterized protein (TIGR03067 family)